MERKSSGVIGIDCFIGERSRVCIDELKWYLYDIVREVLERHGVEKERYCLERGCEGNDGAGTEVVRLWQSEKGFLERKAAETGEQKYGKRLALDRIYLKDWKNSFIR